MNKQTSTIVTLAIGLISLDLVSLSLVSLSRKPLGLMSLSLVLLRLESLGLVVFLNMVCCRPDVLGCGTLETGVFGPGALSLCVLCPDVLGQMSLGLVPFALMPGRQVSLDLTSSGLLSLNLCVLGSDVQVLGPTGHVT